MFYAPGNAIAYLALVCFPLVSLYFFSRKSLAEAIVWTFIVGYLFLPVRTFIDPPVFPVLDKLAIPALTALLFASIYSREKIQLLPRDGVAKATLIALICVPILTAIGNTAPIIIGDTYLPGMQVFGGDAISLLASEFFVLIPFILARQYLADSESHENLIKILVISGLIYTFAIMWEIRMSPQLHTQVYGYFPHEFIQQIRGEGFRAVVFLGHGLLTSILLVMTLVVLLYMIRSGKKVLAFKAVLPAALVFLAIIFNKTFSAYAYTLFAIGFCFLLNSKFRRLSLLAIGILVLTYPIFRTASFYPDEQIVAFAEQYSADRAQSLQFRYDNENILLEKAAEKPIFGWGTWGRNRVYNEDGRDISVTDGGWIIDLGIYGWFGFLCKYLILIWPIFLWLKIKRTYGDKNIMDEVTTLSCIVAIILFDSLLNSGINPITWLISGALLGGAERELKKQQTL